jgi:hypothetical protein
MLQQHDHGYEVTANNSRLISLVCLQSPNVLVCMILDRKCVDGVIMKASCEAHSQERPWKRSTATILQQQALAHLLQQHVHDLLPHSSNRNSQATINMAKSHKTIMAKG